MDEFTCRVEELNSKVQNLALQADACNGSGPTSVFVTGLSNGALLPSSASASQLAKESPLMEEIQAITRSQRQIMHQIDGLSNLLRERLPLGRAADSVSRVNHIDSIGVPVILTLAIAGLGVLFFRSLTSQK